MDFGETRLQRLLYYATVIHCTKHTVTQIQASISSILFNSPDQFSDQILVHGGKNTSTVRKRAPHTLCSVSTNRRLVKHGYVD